MIYRADVYKADVYNTDTERGNQIYHRTQATWSTEKFKENNDIQNHTGLIFGILIGDS